MRVQVRFLLGQNSRTCGSELEVSRKTWHSQELRIHRVSVVSCDRMRSKAGGTGVSNGLSLPSVASSGIRCNNDTLPQFITSVGPNKVLVGHDQWMRRFEGSFKRSLNIASLTLQVVTCFQKDSIAREIVREVKECGGKFLRRVESSEQKRLKVPNEVVAWIETTEIVVVMYIM
jgi:hypothetical protein